MPDDIAIIRSLLDHMEWADAKVLDALRASPGLDPHAQEQFAHVLGAAAVWLSRIEGVRSPVAVWPQLTLDECASLADTIHRGYRSLLERPGDLERTITYTNSAGNTFSNRVLDILLHVAMHGSYHRGMTSIVTRRGGGVAAPTDFIAFIRGAPTATRSDAIDQGA